ncbi:septum formation family protein, partial [Streptomyces sp. EL5]
NPNGKAEGTALTVEVVPCDEAHQGQVVGEFTLDKGDKYPGEAGVSGVADERCPVEAQKYAPDTWALPRGVALFHYTP